MGKRRIRLLSEHHGITIFGIDNKIAVTDPVYTVYVDTNVMAGRTGEMADDGMYEGLNEILTEESHTNFVIICFHDSHKLMIGPELILGGLSLVVSYLT